MTDVIKIALQRRAELSAELNRLDDFIRMAETLVQDHGAEGTVKSEPVAQETTSPSAEASDEQPRDLSARAGTSRPMVFRQKAVS